MAKPPIGLKEFYADYGMWGVNATGKETQLLCATDGTLKVEIAGGGSSLPVEGVAIPTTLADVWVPGLGATVYIDVEFEFINLTAGDDVLERFGVDYGNDGGAIDKYLASWDIPIRTGEVGPRIGPFRIWGDDAIMAEAKTVSTIEMQVYILRQGAASA